MKKYFCTKCQSVFSQSGDNVKCCGEIELFDLIKHGSILESNSNAFVSINKKWKNNRLLKECRDQIIAEGNYGASTIYNLFITQLWDFYNNFS